MNGTAAGTGTPTFDLSRRAISFSGANHYSLPDNTYPSGNTSYTYFMIVTFTVINTGGVLGGGNFSGSDSIGFRNNGGFGGGFYAYWFGNDIYSPISYTANEISSITSFYTSGGSRSLIQNFRTTTSNTPTIPRNQGVGNNAVGRTFGTEWMTGFIHEVIVYNTALITTQRQQVERYLAQKWGLSLEPLLPLTNPTTIPGCQLWFDAADSSTITFSSGSNISIWTNKGSVATTATPTRGATGNQVTYVTIDGYPGVYINNNSSVLYNASTYSQLNIQSNFQNTADYSVFAVVNLSNISSGELQCIYANARGPTGETRTPNFGPGSSFEYNADNTNRLINGSFIGTGRLQTALISSSSALAAITNGIIYASVLSGFTRISTDAGALPVIGGSFGASSGGSDNRFATGYFHEILFYNSVLSESQRQQVETYLASKWNTPYISRLTSPYTKIPPSISFQPLNTSGGTITKTATTTYHVFTSSSNFVVIGNGIVNYLFVGGGGGGGDRHGGGGGAGGVQSGTFIVNSGTYAVTVGLGGAGGNYETNNSFPRGSGLRGGDTTISGVNTGLGGGGGGTYDGPSSGTFGSGGGGGGGAGSGNSPAPSAGTVGQGNSGGSGLNPGGGGGGGAGGAGVAANTGTGGIGTTFYSATLLAVGYGTTFAVPTSPNTIISGGLAYIAGGGGGASGSSPGPGGSGGLGGGGRGDWDNSFIRGGTPNTGGGGGGSRSESGGGSQGFGGGSGLAIIWY